MWYDSVYEYLTMVSMSKSSATFVGEYISLLELERLLESINPTLKITHKMAKTSQYWTWFSSLQWVQFLR